MRRGIVHIGMPRTGSTSLQVILTHLRPHLVSRGILYPEIKPASFLWPSPNHQPFGETLDGRRPRHEKVECLDALSRALAETHADTVILSYEDFAHQRRRFGVPELLKSVFARHGFTMEVVVAVKPPSEHLNSLYSHRAQLVREKRSFSEFARSVWRSPRFDYHTLVEPWTVAAHGRVVGIPLHDRRSSASFVERFFAGLGLSERLGDLIGNDQRTLIENRSPGPIAVEASRRLRRMRVHRQTKNHPREIGRFIDQCAWAKALDPIPFRGNDPDVFTRIDAYFAKTNERFAQSVWGAPWQAIVEEASARPSNELAGQQISQDVEEQIRLLIDDTVAHYGFKRPPRLWCETADLMEAGASRAAYLAGYRGWRVS